MWIILAKQKISQKKNTKILWMMWIVIFGLNGRNSMFKYRLDSNQWPPIPIDQQYSLFIHFYCCLLWMTIKFKFSIRLNSNRITQRVRSKFIVHNVCIMHDDDDDDTEDSSMYRKKNYSISSQVAFFVQRWNTLHK